MAENAFVMPIRVGQTSVRQDVRDAFAKMSEELTPPHVVANLAVARRDADAARAWLKRNVRFNWENDWGDLELDYSENEESGDPLDTCPECDKRVDSYWSYCAYCGGDLAPAAISWDDLLASERNRAESAYLKKCILQIEKSFEAVAA